MKKRMLICGATGFIGKNLLNHFKNDDSYLVRAVYHKKLPPSDLNDGVEWVYADLTNKEHVRQVMKDVDVVLQFAATTSGVNDIVNRPYIHVTDNAVMNSLILRECYENHVNHFVFPSCTVMYQPSEKALKESDLDENLELLPNYFGVGNTKVYIEKMCKFYSRLNRTKHTVIRHSNIYGPHDKYDLERSHVFGATVTKVMKTPDNGTLTVWGSGEERRDLLHVDDLVNFVDLSLKNQKQNYQLYNVGLGSDISIKELVHKIIEISGKNINVGYDLSKPSIKTSLFLDSSRAKQELNWEPKISLEKGIEMILAWYKKNIG